MISDVVCEYLVEKKREKSEIIKSGLLVVAAVVLVILCALLIINVPIATPIAIILMIGIVYLAIKLLGNLSVEYEYCFVNGELTIDKIMNKSTRKNMINLQVKNIEKAGYYNHDKFNPHGAGKIFNFSDSDTPTDAIYLQFRDSTGYINTAIISPSEEFIVKMKPHFNQLVYREAFKK